MFNHKLPQAEFPMQTLRKKTSPCKYKNEPSRFLGEGVFFKAKLIGILEVAEARGDRMCQEALADLKMAIRAAGEHKQRISVHVAIDGLRLRDEKTGDSLYHHPVHKISFIAQDMSDSRAFGYIFGSPDTGHRFFGIKTDKAASQVVIAMRDLFQVVFELKKKEIELAKQQLEGKSILSSGRYLSTATLETTKNGESSASITRSRLGSNVISSLQASTSTNGSSAATSAGNTVAELVDLEQELNSLQRGLHQMERLTPPTDPFGDSFTPTPAPGFLPPPPNSSRGLRTATSITSDGGSPFSPPPVRTHFNFEIPTCSTVSTVVTTTTTTTSVAPLPSPTPTASPIPSLPTHQSPRNIVNKNPVEKVSVEKSSPGILDTTTSVSPLPSDPISLSLLDQLTAGPVIDVFTELDPLGTGRSKPYVDKKHFFQELKNPPKKILKDLVGGVVMPAENLFQSKFDLSPKTELLTTITSVGRQSGGSVSIAKPNSAAQLFSSNTTLFSSDPFAETDPFDNTDPFAESLKDDPFVSSSIDFPPVPKNTMLFEKNIKLPDTKIISDQSSKINFLCAALKSDIVPLQVSLPPEPSVRSPKVAKQITIDKSSIRQRPQSGKQQHIQPSQSPPPPLPPKKPVEKLSDISVGPPLPLPARRRPTTSTPVPPGQILINPINWPNSSTTHEDDYLAPAPALPKRTVPSPSTGPSPGLDITLAQLLTCGMDELAGRLHMPAELLSRMTLAQLTGHLHEYLQTSNKTETLAEQPPKVAERPPIQLQEKSSQFEVNFEENFTSNSDVFEVNFDNFDKSNKDSYDRYAVFREIEAESLNIPVANDPIIPNAEEHDSINSQLDLPCDSSIGHVDNISSILNANFESLNISPVKINQPSPSSTKLEELKNTINNIQKNSMSPTPDIDITLDSNIKSFDNKSKNTMSNVDRYAALRDLSTVEDISRPLSAELSEEPSSAPLQVPKERKKSDEKSDGFDHSDFFDCIDNSLSLTHPDDAFRKSPLIIKEAAQIPEKTIELPDITPIQLTTPVPLVSGSISDVQSGSSPENVLTAERESGVDERDRDRDSSRQSSSKSRKRGDAWALLPSGRRASPPPPSEDGASPWSSDSKESPLQQVKCWPRNYSDAPTRRHRRNPKTSWRTRQTSSSSRDVSPWEEDPPPRDISTHARSYHRERHESVGSSERRDSAGSRERRDSGSGRDRQRRRHQSRNDDKWSDDRDYMGRRLSPCKRSSSREMHRDRAWPGEDHWRPDERGYSTVGRRESRRRGEPPWQGDDPSHRYSCTMGNRSWRRSGSSGEGERRSGGGGSSGAERSRSRIAPSQTSSHRPRPARHRQHRSPFQDNYSRDRSPSPSQATSPSSRQRHQHHFFDDFNHSEVDSPIASKNGTRFRFSNDFSEKDSPKSQNSPFENDFVENTSSLRKSSKYEGSYSNLEKQSPVPRLSNFSCFKYDKDQSSENVNVSPASVRPPPRTSPNSTRSLFEDDFSPEPRNGILRITDNNGDSCRKNVIPEGEEVPSDAKEDKIEKNVGFDLGLGKDVPIPENKGKQKLFGNKPRTKPDLDIKKSESVNIFARDSDPFDGDDFFNSAASEKSKDAWKGEFASFDDI